MPERAPPTVIYVGLWATQHLIPQHVRHAGVVEPGARFDPMRRIERLRVSALRAHLAITSRPPLASVSKPQSVGRGDHPSHPPVRALLSLPTRATWLANSSTHCAVRARTDAGVAGSAINLSKTEAPEFC